MLAELKPVCSASPALMSNCSSEIPRLSARWPYPHHSPRAVAGPSHTRGPCPASWGPKRQGSPQKVSDAAPSAAFSGTTTACGPPAGGRLGEHRRKRGTGRLRCAGTSSACPPTALVGLRQGFSSRPPLPKCLLTPGIMPMLC